MSYIVSLIKNRYDLLPISSPFYKDLIFVSHQKATHSWTHSSPLGIGLLCSGRLKANSKGRSALAVSSYRNRIVDAFVFSSTTSLGILGAKVGVSIGFTFI